MKNEIVLYGTKDGFEDLLSNKAENILFAMFLAKKDGYKDFRIVDYTNNTETPNFKNIF